jgi:palmitoyltransferase ZDHHC9/14/18
VAGPAWSSLLGTSTLILAPSGVFLGLVVPEVAREYSWALLAFALWLPLFSVAVLLITGCSDPGIIPRIPPPDSDEFPNGRPRCAPAQRWAFKWRRVVPKRGARRTKEVDVNGKKVSLKWNDSCNFYQPPRAHHCSVNNDCIEKFDHHCPWVGTTIGQRNYRTFLLFVINTTLLAMYVFALSVVQVDLHFREQKAAHAAGTRTKAASVGDALRESPAAIACIVYTFLGVWFVGGLSVRIVCVLWFHASLPADALRCQGFHAYLVSTNQTTYENFRYSYGRGENPYDRGVLRNCLDVWCAPRLPRKVDFRAFADDADAAPPPVDRDGRALPGALPHQPGCCADDVEAPPPRAASAGRSAAGVQLSARGL